MNNSSGTYDLSTESKLKSVLFFTSNHPTIPPLRPLKSTSTTLSSSTSLSSTTNSNTSILSNSNFLGIKLPQSPYKDSEIKSESKLIRPKKLKKITSKNKKIISKNKKASNIYPFNSSNSSKFQLKLKKYFNNNKSLENYVQKLSTYFKLLLKYDDNENIFSIDDIEQIFNQPIKIALPDTYNTNPLYKNSLTNTDNLSVSNEILSNCNENLSVNENMSVDEFQSYQSYEDDDNFSLSSIGSYDTTTYDNDPDSILKQDSNVYYYQVQNLIERMIQQFKFAEISPVKWFNIITSWKAETSNNNDANSSSLASSLSKDMFSKNSPENFTLPDPKKNTSTTNNNLKDSKGKNNELSADATLQLFHEEKIKKKKKNNRLTMTYTEFHTGLNRLCEEINFKSWEEDESLMVFKYFIYVPSNFPNLKKNEFLFGLKRKKMSTRRMKWMNRQAYFLFLLNQFLEQLTLKFRDFSLSTAVGIPPASNSNISTPQSSNIPIIVENSTTDSSNNRNIKKFITKFEMEYMLSSLISLMMTYKDSEHGDILLSNFRNRIQYIRNPNSLDRNFTQQTEDSTASSTTKFSSNDISINENFNNDQTLDSYLGVNELQKFQTNFSINENLLKASENIDEISPVMTNPSLSDISSGIKKEKNKITSLQIDETSDQFPIDNTTNILSSNSMKTPKFIFNKSNSFNGISPLASPIAAPNNSPNPLLKAGSSSQINPSLLPTPLDIDPVQKKIPTDNSTPSIKDASVYKLTQQLSESELDHLRVLITCLDLDNKKEESDPKKQNPNGAKSRSNSLKGSRNSSPRRSRSNSKYSLISSQLDIIMKRKVEIQEKPPEESQWKSVVKRYTVLNKAVNKMKKKNEEVSPTHEIDNGFSLLDQ